jgi:CubicO group peptidase (beta-lactamase class C family)
MNDNAQKLQTLIDKESRRANTHGVLLGVQSADGRVNFQGAAGDASPNSPYFIASVTKMFTATVIMQLVDEGRLDLDAPITDYLPGDLLDGIHVYEGTDYSHQLKVYQLVQQTSGLADYYEDDLIEDFKHSRDRAYNLDDVLQMVRNLKPSAAPDSGKAHYSDTNYQLLGAIIEAITDCPLAQVFQSRIFGPLALDQTYVFDHTIQRSTPIPLYNQSLRLDVPLAMSSMAPDGGIVSTLSDSLIFLKAYFEGKLFDQRHFERMYQWNPLFFPMQYGYGLMRFRLPRAMTLFRETPELIGHSGSSGSFAFYAPSDKLYMVGTFNQIDKPSRPFNFMLKVAATAT